MTGAGRVGDGGGGLECRFSLKLVREDPESVELLEEVEETERLVFRRSRILITVCIKHADFQLCPRLWQASIETGS